MSAGPALRALARVRDPWLWLPALVLAGAGVALGKTVPAGAAGHVGAVRLGLACAGILVLLVGAWRRGATRTPRPWEARVRMAVLAALCLVGTLNYYRFDARAFTEVGDYYDCTYYYLNSKYFEELGYYDIYRAILLADAEGAGRLKYIRTVRDMHTYQEAPRQRLMADTRALRARFSDARFAAFQHDVDYLVRHKGAGSFDYFFRDHGYNPPPPWTFVGGQLTRRVPVEQIKWITSVDTLLVCGMFALVLWTFGLEVMLLGLLFMVTTASGHWPLVGQAILRFDWLTATVAAMCLWHRGGRPGQAGAGALLAYAALVRVFPAIFFFPHGVVLLRQWRDNGGGVAGIPPAATRFVAGAGIATALLAGGAYLDVGGDAFRDSANNLAMHGSAQSYSSLRVGLGDALIFRGERYWQMLRTTGSIPAKAEQLGALGSTTQAIGLLVLMAVGTHLWRRHRGLRGGDGGPVTQLSYFAFFALTTPQINYHNSRLLLVLWHARGARPVRDTLGLCALFAVEVMAQSAVLGGGVRYTMTSMSSVGLTGYAAVMLGWLLWDARTGGARTRPGAVRRAWAAPAAALAMLLGMALAFGAYWRAGALPPPELRLGLADLSQARATGTRSDTRHCHAFGAPGAAIALGQVSHADSLDLSVDHDDRYRLQLLRGDEVTGTADFSGRRSAGHGRLSRRTVQLPQSPAAAGYDGLRLVPLRGNRHFCLGHLLLRN